MKSSGAFFIAKIEIFNFHFIARVICYSAIMLGDPNWFATYTSNYICNNSLTCSAFFAI